MANRVTQKQLEALQAIEDYTGRYGWAPTIRELGGILGLGTLAGSVNRLVPLEKKGLIIRGSGSRMIRITPKGKDLLNGKISKRA